jgi:hypothetical protein
MFRYVLEWDLEKFEADGWTVVCFYAVIALSFS